MVNAISLNNITYSKTSDWLRKKITLLKNINLEVKAAESFGFLGHNGAGKTTTIRCILDFLKATSGDISIFGIDNKKSESRKNVGFLSEQPYLYDNLSVVEILNLYASLLDIKSTEKNHRISELLKLLGIESKSSSRIGSLSKGQMQRVGLAGALIGRPKLLILDEPFSGLDPIGRKEFRDIFYQLKNEGVTLFMSSHILSDVQFLCERASILVKGELKGVFDLKNLPGSKKIYEVCFKNSLGIDISIILEKFTDFEISGNLIKIKIKEDEQKAQELIKMIVESSLSLESYEVLQTSLEDLFISVTNS